VPKADELIATPFRFGGDKGKAKAFFESGLRSAFDVLHKAQDSNFPMTIYYAFKQTETQNRSKGDKGSLVSSTGWETMLEGLLGAGFSVTATWPVRTEKKGRILAVGTNALASSIVLACRPRAIDATSISRGDFRRMLTRELDGALHQLQQGNIAPVDLAQASLGPGISIFSRYARVVEADGSAMKVRTALQMINETMDELLNAHEGEFDADTQFAVTWHEQYGWATGSFGDGETLAKARNVSVSGVVEAGIAHAAAGMVRLLKRSELPNEWDPGADDRLTVWEATQHLINRLELVGEDAAASLLAALGPVAAQARNLAYRLYTTCERKGWAEEAQDYNGLVLAWPELERLAEGVGGLGGPSPQAELFE
jgi:putative DNA methylase